MPLSLDTRFCGNIFILEGRGQIVIGKEVQLLEASLQAAAREFSRIVLDMKQVTRLDSIGLGFLVRSLDKLRKKGGDLHIAEPPQFLLDLLRITKLAGYVNTYATEDEAILSFLNQQGDKQSSLSSGHRVLVIDPSADLGAFVRAVLTQHGFEVMCASLIHDAQMLLRFEPVDIILFGPGNSSSVAQSEMASLQSLAPHATSLTLSSDFRTLDALRGAEVLLELFQVGSAPA